MEAPTTTAGVGGGNAATTAANAAAPPPPLGKAPFGSLEILNALGAAGTSGDYSFMLEPAPGLEPDVAAFVSVSVAFVFFCL